MAQAPNGRSDRAKAVLSKLNWVLSLTRLGLFSERLIRAFWPVWSILFVLSAALMMGVQDGLSVETVWAGAVLGLVALLYFVWRGLRQMSLPSRQEALWRLDDTLPGRPVQSLLDQPALKQSDPATLAIWQAHQNRMAERAATARAPRPNWDVSHLDPFGLRFTALLGLCVALLFGSVNRVTSVAAMTPGGAQPGVALASWEGWITPPAYTGLPALYLADLPQGVLEVPENSQITLRLYGEIGALTVGETVSARTEVPSAADPVQTFLVKQDGMLEIAGESGGRWDVSMVADTPPELTFVGEPTASGLGEMSVPFTAVDDYAVVSGTAQLTLDLARVERIYGRVPDPEDLTPVDLQLPLPITGKRQFFNETLIDDFSAHRWAHLPVQLTLQINDAAGQMSAPRQIFFELPARQFFDPMANALVEMRRDLLWSRENGPRVAQLMRAISHRPDEGVFRKDKDYLRLRTILRHLERVLPAGIPDEDLTSIAEELWAFAMELEEGDLDDAFERMAQAQERLREAMRNGASAEEIQRLMQELREATNDYMRQLAQQNQGEGGEDGDSQTAQQQQSQNEMEMSQSDLQRMMDMIQELMEQGRMAEAQQALEEFQRMMENMQVTEGGQSGSQAMQDLGQALRDQQGLSDQAFRELQEQFNPDGQPGQPGQEGQGTQGQGFSSGQSSGRSEGQQGGGTGQSDTGQSGTGQDQTGQGQNGEGTPGESDLEGSLAEQQRQLRQEIERQQSQLPGAGTPEGDAARESLDRAGEAMDGAEEALRNNDLAEAIDRQSEAMEALREGMRNLGEAFATNEDGSIDDSMDTSGSSLDPLGRTPGQRGGVGTEDGLLQGEDVYRRAQDLLEEIRRRAGDSERPEIERNYLKRLLERF